MASITANHRVIIIPVAEDINGIQQQNLYNLVSGLQQYSLDTVIVPQIYDVQTVGTTSDTTAFGWESIHRYELNYLPTNDTSVLTQISNYETAMSLSVGTLVTWVLSVTYGR